MLFGKSLYIHYFLIIFFISVKDELDYFYKSLLEMPFLNLLEQQRKDLEKKINKIITQNCNNFIELTSLN